MIKKILIVDDEESILHVLKRLLSNPYTEVITATKIEEAEYAINTSRFDLIIADIRLTGVLGTEGLEILRYVKSKSPSTRVILMTGYGSPEMEKDAYAMGASYYFDKPIDLRVLMDKIRELGVIEK